jgi:hypothetical protein
VGGDILCSYVKLGKVGARKDIHKCPVKVETGTCGNAAPFLDITSGKMVCLEHANSAGMKIQ